jgi:hypothetical protein
MASELRVDTLKDASGANSIGLSYVANGSAKAWVFGSNSAGLNDSFSISSGTDHGTGDYSYALSNAFSSANFAQQSTSGSGTPSHSATTNHSRITSSVAAIETSDDSSNSDKQHHVTVHGDLA